MTKRDPFQSPFDASDSIGCACPSSKVDGLAVASDEAFEPKAIVGFSFNFNPKGALDLDKSLGGLGDKAKAELDKVNSEASKTIGKAAGAYAKVAGKVEEAVELGKGVKEAVDALDMTGKDVGDAIQAVAGNPLTHAALAGVAIAAPPFSTIAAGIAELGLGLAAGAVEVVKGLENVWNDIFMSYTQKCAKLWGVSEAEAQRLLDFDKSRDATRKEWDKNQKAAKEQLAAIKEKALIGDKQAVAMLAALESLMSFDRLLLVTILRFGCTDAVRGIKETGKSGLTPSQLCDVARVVLADEERAAKMSQKEFDYFRGLGRTFTDSKGKTTGTSLDYLKDEGGAYARDGDGKYIMAIYEIPSMKVLKKGEAALVDWRNRLHFLLDERTRKVNLGEALRGDFFDAFKGSLIQNWDKLDKEATKLAEERQKEKAALRKKVEKYRAALKPVQFLTPDEKKKLGIPSAVGDVATGYFLSSPSPKDAKKAKKGTFRITSKRTADTHGVVILPTGRVVLSYWEEIT